MERKSRQCWKYLFCFAEPDFTPRQGHQHSAFVTAELQQASLVCGGGAGEAVGALLGAAGGGARGRLKSFHPLLALPCGHVHEWEAETEKRRWCMRIQVGERQWKRERKKSRKARKRIRQREIGASSSLWIIVLIHHFCIPLVSYTGLLAPKSLLHTDAENSSVKKSNWNTGWAAIGEN